MLDANGLPVPCTTLEEDSSSPASRDSGLLQTILINSRREYMLHHQQQLFDEDT